MLTIDKFPVYAPKTLPKAEPFVSCMRSCRGCGKATAARIAAKAVSNGPALDAAASSSPCSHAYAHDSLGTAGILEGYFSRIDSINSDAAMRSASGHKAIGKPVIAVSRRIFSSDCLALAGLLQGSRPALYLCLDNESDADEFIRTAGVQSFTLNDAKHSISQHDITAFISEKNMPCGCMQEGFSYAATACTSYLFDFIEKIKRGISCAGNACISVLTPCPTGWGFPPKLAHAVGKYAVQTGYFPLYEMCGGTVTVSEPRGQRKPLQQFLSAQKRFSTFPAPLLPLLQEAVDSFNAGLQKKTYG